MQLTVRDAAQILAVSEKTIYRWLDQGILPAYRVNTQYRFNKAELLEWAQSRRINVSAAFMQEPDNAGQLSSLGEALAAGGIHFNVAGDDKEAVLRNVVQLLKLPDDVDRQFLVQILLAREAMGSTGIGDGIAIPHVRNPIVLGVAHASVALCFLQTPVDFAAIDNRPLSILFTLICPTIKEHLHLLSRLSFALQNPDVRGLLTAGAGGRGEVKPEEILRRIATAEAAASVATGEKEDA
jgi:nitrogen PTS system EIIA component